MYWMCHPKSQQRCKKSMVLTLTEPAASPETESGVLPNWTYEPFIHPTPTITGTVPMAKKVSSLLLDVYGAQGQPVGQPQSEPAVYQEVQMRAPTSPDPCSGRVSIPFQIPFLGGPTKRTKKEPVNVTWKQPAWKLQFTIFNKSFFVFHPFFHFL